MRVPHAIVFKLSLAIMAALVAGDARAEEYENSIQEKEVVTDETFDESANVGAGNEGACEAFIRLCRWNNPHPQGVIYYNPTAQCDYIFRICLVEELLMH